MNINVLNKGLRSIVYKGGVIHSGETNLIEKEIAEYLERLFKGEIVLLQAEKTIVIEEPKADEVEVNQDEVIEEIEVIAEAVEEVIEEPKSLVDLKFAELKDIAIEKGLDITGLKSKAELINLIENN